MCAALDRDIAALDVMITAQLNAILAAEELQLLEATWRGARYLTRLTDKGDRVKCRILDASWPDVARDFERAPDYDQSTLFELIYSQEFDMAGGEPFGILVGDYYLSHEDTNPRYGTDDMFALESMTMSAAAAFSPFVCSCDPQTLGLKSFEPLCGELDLEAVFRQPVYKRWNRLRDMEDARFLGICVPRVLLREPWSAESLQNVPFRFQPGPGDGPRPGPLWGNAAFAFAAIAIRAFVQNGWFADIRGVRRGESGGGLVPALALDVFGTDTPPIAFKHPVEVAISDRHRKSLGDLGIIPVSIAEYVPAAIFYGNQSMQRVQRYNNVVATANARLSSMLQYVLCIARFAHVMKVIGRDLVASFATAAECQSSIQSWLSSYVQANPKATLEMRTKYPLREGRVSVSENPARPGTFKLDMYLQPHLQLDDISETIRLTSELRVPHRVHG
jgi:type VI secretion system protein ImpD